MKRTFSLFMTFVMVFTTLFTFAPAAFAAKEEIYSFPLIKEVELSSDIGHPLSYAPAGVNEDGSKFALFYKSNFWVYDVNTGEEKKFGKTEGNIYPVFNKDLSKAAYLHVPTGKKGDPGSFYLVDIETGEEISLNDGKTGYDFPVFTEDSSKVFFTEISDFSVVYYDLIAGTIGKFNLEEGQRPAGKELPYGYTYSLGSAFAPSKDGSTIAIRSTDSTWKNVKISVYDISGNKLEELATGEGFRGVYIPRGITYEKLIYTDGSNGYFKEGNTVVTIEKPTERVTLLDNGLMVQGQSVENIYTRKISSLEGGEAQFQSYHFLSGDGTKIFSREAGGTSIQVYDFSSLVEGYPNLKKLPVVEGVNVEQDEYRRAVITWDTAFFVSRFEVYEDENLIKTVAPGGTREVLRDLPRTDTVITYSVVPVLELGNQTVIGVPAEVNYSVEIDDSIKVKMGTSSITKGDYVQLGFYLWRALSDDILVTETSVAKMRPDTEKYATTLNPAEATNVAHYINNAFLNTFTQEHKDLLLPSTWNITLTTSGSTTSSYMGYVGLPTFQQVRDAGFKFKTNTFTLSSKSSTAYNANIVHWDYSEDSLFYSAPWKDMDTYPVVKVVPNAAITGGSGTQFDPYIINSTGVSLTAPQNLRAEETGSTNVKLVWDSVSNAVGYDILRNGTLVTTVAYAEFNDSGLTSDTSYVYSVRAKGPSGEIGPVSTLSVKTVSGPITQAPVVTSSAVTDTNSTITWSSVQGADSYVVYRNGAEVYSGTSLSYVDTTLSPKTSYTYQVHGVNGLGEGPAGSVVVTTNPSAPTQTPFVVIEDATDTSISFSWNEVEDATEYVVERDGVEVYRGSSTGLTDVGLSENQQYRYSFYAQNSTGRGPVVELDASTTLRKLPAPADITVTQATYEGVNLIWTPVVDATEYLVERDGELVYKGLDNFYFDANPNVGRTSAYSVAALNQTVKGSEISVSVFVPTGAPEITDPTTVRFKADNVGQKEVVLSWDAIPDANRYKVFRNVLGESAMTLVYEGPNTTILDTNLSEQTSYVYSLVAVNHRGESAPISIEVTTLPGDRPVTPTGLKVNRVFSDGASLQWNFVEGAESYTVYRDGGVIAYQGTSTTFRDNTLDQKSTHNYYVVAKNRWGESDPTDTITITTLEEVPSIVIVPSDNPPVSGQITFSFQIIEGAYEYHVERNPHWVYRDNGDGTFHLTYENLVTGVTQDYGNVIPVDGKLGFSEEGVDPGTNYHYDVVAVRKNEDGSEEIIGHTPVEVTTPSDGSGTTIDEPIGTDPNEGGSAPGDGGSSPGSGGSSPGSGGSSGGSGGSSGGSSGGGSVGGDGGSGGTGKESEGSKDEGTPATEVEVDESNVVENEDGSSSVVVEPSPGSEDKIEVTIPKEILDEVDEVVVNDPDVEVTIPSDSVGEEGKVIVEKKDPVAPDNRTPVSPEIVVNPGTDKDVTIKIPVPGDPSDYDVVIKDPVTGIPVTVPGNGSDGKVVITVPGGSSVIVVEKKPVFSDIEDHWAKDDILELVDKGIITGMPNGTFAPNEAVTREQFSAMVYRALGLEEVEEFKYVFPDINDNRWSYEIIHTTNYHDLLLGYGDGLFHPEINIPREQILAILTRIFTYAGVDLEYEEGALNKFGDGNEVSGWAIEEVSKAVDNGLAQGNTQGNLEPHRLSTRAEAAVFIKRALDILN